MNLNKLLEASIYARVQRGGGRYRPKVAAKTMQSELELSIQLLGQAGLQTRWERLAVPEAHLQTQQ